MIKLYILSMLFCLGCMYIGSRHTPTIAKKLNVEMNKSKVNNREWLKLAIITSVIPVLNIIVGVSFLLFFTGKIDDEIIERLNKK